MPNQSQNAIFNQREELFLRLAKIVSELGWVMVIPRVEGDIPGVLVGEYDWIDGIVGLDWQKRYKVFLN